ncbi:hypothetical protein [Oricola thermophila]|uniref:Uncharacterized protein n=1 Tax=Oricola thermophila TaxID=2742145 RepID=A0A6N1VF18_9HYPH|nr:hypothetical protein [Oricola thermophila]QKV17729.1 hypothetical protein HTY61_04220 [Oricola thermophila]
MTWMQGSSQGVTATVSNQPSVGMKGSDAGFGQATPSAEAHASHEDRAIPRDIRSAIGTPASALPFPDAAGPDGNMSAAPGDGDTIVSHLPDSANPGSRHSRILFDDAGTYRPAWAG